MTGDRRRRAPPPEPPASGLLDWSGSSHWDSRPRPCRYCGKPARLRDSKGSPAHKVCAEEVLARRAAEAAEAYENERLH
ncbi:hypothetical protein [Streptomyces sp. NPDC023838]|uniref:hypothetical protein n=1 Tax=Streptomyces sp. NPDC023838 TaxID=3154325 RepID=UPI0033E64307